MRLEYSSYYFSYRDWHLGIRIGTFHIELEPVFAKLLQCIDIGIELLVSDKTLILNLGRITISFWFDD